MLPFLTMKERRITDFLCQTMLMKADLLCRYLIHKIIMLVGVTKTWVHKTIIKHFTPCNILCATFSGLGCIGNVVSALLKLKGVFCFCFK